MKVNIIKPCGRITAATKSFYASIEFSSLQGSTAFKHHVF
jgi:hypothetical protein